MASSSSSSVSSRTNSGTLKSFSMDLTEDQDAVVAAGTKANHVFAENKPERSHSGEISLSGRGSLPTKERPNSAVLAAVDFAPDEEMQAEFEKVTKATAKSETPVEEQAETEENKASRTPSETETPVTKKKKKKKKAEIKEIDETETPAKATKKKRKKHKPAATAEKAEETKKNRRTLQVEEEEKETDSEHEPIDEGEVLPSSSDVEKAPPKTKKKKKKKAKAKESDETPPVEKIERRPVSHHTKNTRRVDIWAIAFLIGGFAGALICTFALIQVFGLVTIPVLTEKLTVWGLSAIAGVGGAGGIAGGILFLNRITR